MPETPVPVRPRPITASQLYDLATCRHRVAIDFERPRSERTPPDATSQTLMERGLELEARIRERLGGVLIAARPEDPAAAMAETLEAMRAGEGLIHQGVLAAGGRLAIPDVLRRVEGASALGPHHYEAGDIKSGLTPRTDMVLQVVFAAKLLEDLQERRPDEGFLILGDEAETRFRLDDVWDSGMRALATLESIARGETETFPFYSTSCARCRWRAVCLPELARGPDLSLVAGMTWTRKRILRSHRISTAGELAAVGAADLARLVDQGVATDGLKRLQKQAEALVTNRILDEPSRRASPPPGAAAAIGMKKSEWADSYLVCEWSPLGEAHPFFFAWGTCEEPPCAANEARIHMGMGAAVSSAREVNDTGDKSRESAAIEASQSEAGLIEERPADRLSELRGGKFGEGSASKIGDGSAGRMVEGLASRIDEGHAHVRVETHLLLDPLDPDATSALVERLAVWAAASRGAIFHFGAAAIEAIDWLAQRHPGAAALERMVTRLRNLAPLVRRGAYLPVRRYVASEIAAVLEGRPLPPLEDPPDASFLWAEELRRGTEGDWSQRLSDRARTDLQGLVVLRDWAERRAEAGPSGTAEPRTKPQPVRASASPPIGTYPRTPEPGA